MALLFIIFVYNAVSIPLRASFGLDTSNSTDPSLIVVWLVCDHLADLVLGRHGSDSLCRDERENKMAATYNVLAFKR